jgi:hypothetical protein
MVVFAIKWRGELRKPLAPSGRGTPLSLHAAAIYVFVRSHYTKNY